MPSPIHRDYQFPKWCSVKLEDWGRRRLAYKIEKFSGYYILADFAECLPGVELSGTSD
jgi:ribosomal protein S6